MVELFFVTFCGERTGAMPSKRDAASSHCRSKSRKAFARSSLSELRAHSKHCAASARYSSALLSVLPFVRYRFECGIDLTTAVSIEDFYLKSDGTTGRIDVA